METFGNESKSVEITEFQRNCPFSRKMPQPWNRELGWSVVFSNKWVNVIGNAWRVIGATEPGWETWWSEVAWFGALRHRPTAVLSVQQCRRQPHRPIRSWCRCRLCLRLRADFVCGLSVWLRASRTCTSSAVPARVSCQLCRSVAEGLILHHFVELYSE